LILEEESIDSIYQALADTFAITPPGKIITYIDSLELQISVGRDSLDYLYQNDSLIHDYMSQYSEELTEEEILALDENVNNIRYDLNQTWNLAHNQLVNHIDTVFYDLIADVSTETTIETNFKDYFLTLFDEILRADGYNKDTVLNDMEIIASQCPFEGGPAGYLARNLISMVDSSRIYDDETICYGAREGKLIEQPNEPNKIISSKVYPNPFKEGFIISLLGLKDDDVDIAITIHDLTGRLIWQEKVNSNKFPYAINVNDRNSGIYFLELINVNSNERISNHKIIQVE
jgi:Secretion system C-terminal sorting domain